VSVSLLAQLSDPHVRVDDDGASARALAAAVHSVLELRPAPQAVVVSGDLADGAATGEYERLRELLEPLPMPVHVLAGNHDDRDALREHFGPAQARGPGERLR
jgi:Icc protein